jgi:hypothetical protein
MATTVTRTQATEVLAEVSRVFAAHIEGDNAPGLLKDWDWTGTGAAPYAIVWEEGPFDWATCATFGTPDEFGIRIEAITQPTGVFCEPITSWALGIYSA